MSLYNSSIKFILNLQFFQPSMVLTITTLLGIFAVLATKKIVFSQIKTNDCPLNIQFGSNVNDSNCEYAFDAYLFALSKRANQTGQIFLDLTQQKSCLDSIKKVDRDYSNCGIEKLIRGDSRCSNYSVTDVQNKMGNSGKKLEQGCDFFLSGYEYDICKFSVLVALASTKVDDENWIKTLHKCPGQQNQIYTADDQGIERNDDNKHSRKVKISIGFLIGGVVGAILILIVATWAIFWKSRKQKLIDAKPDLNYSSIVVNSPRKITLKDVYFATNDLNESNFIGQGIAGKVYKGILLNGKHIAVKHITNEIQKETFVREVQSLSHVKHPNLVTLIGHCERENESFLIYELCHNGNLSEWLFGKEKYLTWSKRLEIALDCARGLLFLHTYPQGCIVHRDIKPTNILICADFQGKLSDFGLSKIMKIGQSFVSSEVRGTFGYVDPEYQNNHRVNWSGDVYSFGIVLLQLLSGRRVINFDIEKAMPISKMAKALTKSGNTSEFADPKLNGEYSDEAFKLVLNLALSCSGIKQKRPTMKKVVPILERALHLSAMDKSQIPSFSQGDV